MANQIINVGTAANSGGGDPLRTAMIKINENFSELYTDITELQLATGTTSGGTIVVNAIQGSVIGEDSTVIVDASTSTVDAGRLTGTLPAIDGSALTGVTVSSIAFADVTSTPTTVAGYGITDAFDGVFASLTSKPTTLAGYGIADAYTQTQVDTAITNATSSIVIPTGSTQSIDVVAQDSTVLVDSVNGTLNATTLTGALPAIDGSALTNLTIPTQSALDDGLGVATVTTSAVTGVTIGGTAGITLIGAAAASINIGGSPSGTVTIGSGTNTVDYPSGTTVDFTGATITGTNFLTTVAFSDLTGKPTTIAGYGITDALQLGTSSTTALAGDTALFSGAFADLTSKPTTLAGYGITDALSSGGNITLGGDLDVGGNSIVSASNGPINIAPNGSGAIELNGQVKFAEGMIEKFATTNGATGVTALDCSTGNVHYLTAPAGDITANFTNLNLTAEYATNVTVVIDQGGTEREITAVQIGGVAQTIVWQGNSAPTGTANGVDSFSFTILNDGGTYVVLGQMVAFGGV